MPPHDPDSTSSSAASASAAAAGPARAAARAHASADALPDQEAVIADAASQSGAVATTAGPNTLATAEAGRVSVVFAGGGTGGHLMPALAIAERLAELAPGIGLHFICADREIDQRILGPAGVSLTPTPARPPTIRPFPVAPLRFARTFRSSAQKAEAVLADFAGGNSGRGGSRCLLVAMGGYVSGPAAWAAHRLRRRASGGQECLPIVLMNLDRVPGRANRFVARLADEVLTATDVINPTASFRNVRRTGLPIRRQALAGDLSAEACRQHFGLAPDRHTLLITGASQGAESLNRLMIALARSLEGRRALSGWQILHLAGDAKAEDRAALVEAYEWAEIPHQVIGFCDEMGCAWGAADLALSRAGASSVAEAAANAVPTVFAPYPWHADRHQERNAEPLVARGGAWMTTDHVDPERNRDGLGRLLLTAIRDADTRRRAVIALEAMQGPDAATTIARRLIEILQVAAAPVGRGGASPEAEADASSPGDRGRPAVRNR
ncbi:MAG: UDP-N-acetylglucosamine--N-acetylmuramyl-(pentapeptide) pyrophosphoryl-undecaprenol N-acetylglucosamine transferase [Planctomycetota bacterium]